MRYGRGGGGRTRQGLPGSSVSPPPALGCVEVELGGWCHPPGPSPPTGPLSLDAAPTPPRGRGRLVPLRKGPPPPWFLRPEAPCLSDSRASGHPRSLWKLRWLRAPGRQSLREQSVGSRAGSPHPAPGKPSRTRRCGGQEGQQRARPGAPGGCVCGPTAPRVSGGHGPHGAAGAKLVEPAFPRMEESSVGNLHSG